MKVLAFSRIFPSEREPAHGIYNLRRFRALSAFCDVRVVAPRPVWAPVRVPVSRNNGFARYDGLDVVYPTYWRVPRIAPQWHAATMHWSVRSDVLRLRREFPFDLILGAFAYPDLVTAAALAAEANCPLVGLVMGSDVNDLAGRLVLREQIAQAFNQARAVIALSSALKHRVIELGIPDNRVVVQANGVDGIRFQIRDRRQAREALDLPVDRRIVCFVGNLVPVKGPDVLVEAIARMDQQCLSSLHVVFVGDGELNNRLRTRCDQLGLSGHVRFAGLRAPDEIPLWMAAADVLCLPSRREGCPNVVLEALASGRPVVASNVGGVPDLLTEKNGVLVLPDDPTRLAAALQVALQRTWDPSDLRSSVPSLSWNDFGRTFHQVLLAALDGSGVSVPAL